LQVNRAAPRIYTVHEERAALPPVVTPGERLPHRATPRLADATRRGARRHAARKRARPRHKKR
jgi:hypothetical protein